MDPAIFLFNLLTVVGLCGIAVLTVYGYVTYWRKGAPGAATA